MPKLSSYENPLSGKSGNIFDLGGMMRLIVGAALLFLAFGFGASLAGFVRRVLPGRIGSLASTPSIVASAPAASSNSVAPRLLSA